MKARDVMVSPVITVKPNSSVREIAKTLLEKRISAVPVIDDGGKLVGMISEGDLMHRSEAGTERQRSWWLRLMAGDDVLAADYVKAHGRKVADVMTQNIITATPDTPLDEIAVLLEMNSIKRVPIVKDGQLVGIVSRANLVQAVASAVDMFAVTTATFQLLYAVIVLRHIEEDSSISMSPKIRHKPGYRAK